MSPLERQARMIGALLTLLVGLFFTYPSQAYPLQSLFATGLVLAMALALSAMALALRREVFLTALGSAGSIAFGLFALWSFVRWQNLHLTIPDDPTRTVSVTSAGRPLVTSFALTCGAMVLGLALSTLGPREGPKAWMAFRRVAMLLAIALSIQGLYQYFLGYDLAIRDFRRDFGGQQFMTDLMRQSVEHALRERRVGGRLGNGNVFAALISVLGALSLSGWAARAPRPERVLGSLAYLGCAVTLVLTGSRGGFLTFVFATAGALVVLSIDRKAEAASGGTSNAKLGAVIPAALGFTLLARIASAAGVWERLGNSATIRERFFYWQVAMKVWATNWWAGGGPGSFILYYPRFKPPTARESRFTHSWIFQTGAETGIVGLALIIVFWGAIFWAGIRAARTRLQAGSEEARGEGAAEALWLALACLILGFNGLFEYSLQMREFLLLLGFLAGGLIGLAPPGSGRWMPARTAAGAIGLAGAIAVAGWQMPREQIAIFHEWQAKAYLADEQPGAAAAAYQKAGAWLPDDESFVAGHALSIMRMRGQGNAALELFQKAERMNPLSARIRQYQGEFFTEARQPETAVKKMNEAVLLYPFDADHRLSRAEALLNWKHPAEARADLDFIEANRLPLWEFQRPRFKRLAERAAISAANPAPPPADNSGTGSGRE